MYIPTQCSFFKLLAPVQTVSELEQSNIVFCNLVDEMSCRSELTKGKFVMVLVIKDVH